MKLNHAKVSAIADGGDATLVRPSDWNADIGVTVPDTDYLQQTRRYVLPSTDRLIAESTGRVSLVEAPQPFMGAYKVGSMTIYNDAYCLQYKRATINSTARVTLAGTGELFMFDLAPVGRLVLAGRGG